MVLGEMRLCEMRLGEMLPNLFSRGNVFRGDDFEWHVFYARKQLLLSARLGHGNSVVVCLSVTRVDQSKRCKLG